MPNMNENGQLIARLYGAFESSDLDTIRESLDEDVVLHQAGRGPLAGVHKGRDEVLGVLGSLIALSEGTFRSKVHDILANDEHVVVLSENTASARGKSLQERGVEIFHVTDGKVTEAFFTAFDLYEMDEFFTT